MTANGRERSCAIYTLNDCNRCKADLGLRNLSDSTELKGELCWGGSFESPIPPKSRGLKTE